MVMSDVCSERCGSETGGLSISGQHRGYGRSQALDGVLNCGTGRTGIWQQKTKALEDWSLYEKDGRGRAS